MLKAVLVIFVLNTYGSTSQRVEMKSLEFCNAHKDKILSAMVADISKTVRSDGYDRPNTGVGSMRVHMTATCVPTE